ncbi:hypothetical protein AJ87_10635 [Rhizobium yanglingense]|nr:hypothetical protein AJ87_10635 [Rhizobium yanglingense]
MRALVDCVLQSATIFRVAKRAERLREEDRKPFTSDWQAVFCFAAALRNKGQDCPRSVNVRATRPKAAEVISIRPWRFA